MTLSLTTLRIALKNNLSKNLTQHHLHLACKHSACKHSACKHSACKHSACKHSSQQHSASTFLMLCVVLFIVMTFFVTLSFIILISVVMSCVVMLSVAAPTLKKVIFFPIESLKKIIQRLMGQILFISLTKTATTHFSMDYNFPPLGQGSLTEGKGSVRLTSLY
jgi:hypothetical protein